MQMKNNKIDIIIPAYKAQKTIMRTLSSVAEQTIVGDLEVTIVNDGCPNGDYQKFVDMFSGFFPIREVKLDENGGPGVARQKGIDETRNEFFTCIDADDTFAGTIALEILRAAITESQAFQCASGTFLQLGESLQQIVPHQNDMVWMFGKLYRREFIEKYKICFNDTRANEDTGFNTWVRLLCNNPVEQIRFVPETVYYWHNKEDSITRINDGQYGHDQCFCGWIDNMIYAIKNVRKVRPFDGSTMQWIATCMINAYFYYCQIYARKNVFAEQAWEFSKKFYHACYKRIEEDITDDAMSQLFSMACMEKYGHGEMLGVLPHIGIKEFLEKLKTEEYDENHIYDVWAKIPEELIRNNEECGVCPKGYTNKPF